MKLTWPTVVLILGALAIVGALAWKGVDTASIIGLIITLIGGVTLGAVTQVKEQTNGQLSQLVSLVREQSQTLSRTQPPSPAIITMPPVTEAKENDSAVQG